MNTRLVVTAVAAAVSVGAAVILVSTAPREAEPGAQPTPTSPGAVWTLAASDVLGNEFATFEDPVGARFGDVKGGVVDAGDILVAKVGLTNQETREFEQAELVGFDAATGDVRWTSSADGVESCSTSLLDGLLLCRSGSSIVTVDTTDGEIARHPTEWNIYSVSTDGTDIYVMEGEVDGTSTRIHRGTLDAPDSRWSLTMEDAYFGMDTYGDMIEFAGGVGITKFLSSTTVFDPETGEILSTFGLPDCVRAQSVRGDQVHLVLGRHCSDLFEYRTDVVDAEGKVLATVDAEAWQQTLIDAPTDPQDPILLNGNAFDPVSGRELWSGDRYGISSDIAIVGDVVLAGDAPALDLHTGEPAWPEDTEPLLDTPDVLYDGEVWVRGWMSDIVSIDPATGARRASVSIEGLLGNTRGRSEQVALLGVRDGVVVVNETRLNLVR